MATYFLPRSTSWELRAPLLVKSSVPKSSSIHAVIFFSSDYVERISMLQMGRMFDFASPHGIFFRTQEPIFLIRITRRWIPCRSGIWDLRFPNLGFSPSRVSVSPPHHLAVAVSPSWFQQLNFTYVSVPFSALRSHYFERQAGNIADTRLKEVGGTISGTAHTAEGIQPRK